MHAAFVLFLHLSSVYKLRQDPRKYNGQEEEEEVPVQPKTVFLNTLIYLSGFIGLHWMDNLSTGPYPVVSAPTYQITLIPL